MRLQADPTIIYGLLPNFNGNITKKNLKNDATNMKTRDAPNGERKQNISVILDKKIAFTELFLTYEELQLV